MKTAQQAFDEAIDNLTIESNRELREVSRKIDEAINNGKFYICEVGELNPYTVHKLTRLGYGVSHDYTHSTWHYFISWFACDVYKDELTGCKPRQPSNNQTTSNTDNKGNKRKFPIFRR